MELPFKNSRKQAGLSAQSAANLLHMDKRTIYRIEAGQQPALAQLVWDMAKLYNDPSLVRWQQCEADPIGRRVNPPVLNGIVNNPQAVHCKMAEELAEAALAAAEMCRFVINKMTACDFSDHERRQYFALYGKSVSNVKQAIAEVEGVMMKMFGVEAIEVAGSAHRDKMLQKGYLRTKEKALSGAIQKLSDESLPLTKWQVKEESFYYQ